MVAASLWSASHAWLLLSLRHRSSWADKSDNDRQGPDRRDRPGSLQRRASIDTAGPVLGGRTPVWRQNLAGDFFDSLVMAAYQERVDPQFYVVLGVVDAIGAVLVIKHSNAYPLAQDFVRFTAKKRSEPFPEPEPFFSHRPN